MSTNNCVAEKPAIYWGTGVAKEISRDLGPSDCLTGRLVGSRPTGWDISLPGPVSDTSPTSSVISHPSNIHVPPSNPSSIMSYSCPPTRHIGKPILFPLLFQS